MSEIGLKEIFDHMNERFDGLDTKLNGLDKRVQKIEKNAYLLKYTKYVVGCAVLFAVFVTTDGSVTQRWQRAKEAMYETVIGTSQ
jgi:hypothetical protein